jgi:MarR family 2-MHQ and catechol resistance regulon transcriptional repressor
MTLATADRQLDRDARALHQALNDLVRIYQFRDRDRICCHDISVTQCYALDALVRRGPSGLNDLAAELYLDKSTASRVVDALERKRYVRRRPDPADGRAVLLELTPAGSRLVAQIEGELLAEERALLASFPPAVRRSMTELLERLGAAAAERCLPESGCCAP